MFDVQLPERVNRDEINGRLAEEAIQSKRYLPAIHLMSFYRDGLGYARGDLPVTERTAGSSVALPFFPEMTEGQVARVAGRLSQLLEV